LDKHLHIISLDVPYPANYGGVYDLFYKLPALQSQGVKIILHCFDNGRGQQPELNKYCERVYYYPRNTGHKGFTFSLPYIVSSRNDETLLQNLLKDEYPIFMEGIHCTYPAIDHRFNGRKKFVRIHNVEHSYYQRLYSCSHNLFNKAYYRWESNRLFQYERALVNKATAFWAVTEKDTQYFRDHFDCKTIDYLPLFIPPWEVRCQAGMGTYCLYHGDLSVASNDEAAKWLLQHVFGKLQIPFVVAGKNPSAALEKIAHQNMHTCLVANPSEMEMQDMIAKAQINILPSFNNTGIQIKLLNALFNGRHCLVNKNMVAGTGLEELCVVAETAESFSNIVAQMFHQKITDDEIEARKSILEFHFNNEKGAKQMLHWIWEQYK